MISKIQISGNVEVLTGMHIGGGAAFAAIGAVDSTVVKDVKTGNPMIPGSSLKGKLRTLLAKMYNEEFAKMPDEDSEIILNLFGSAKKNKVRASRIIVSDMFLLNAKEIRERGSQSLTEVKFENNINRATAVAMPRQIERVVRGAIFGLDIIYEVSENMGEEDVLNDFKALAKGLKMLQYDYLGGSGSRGYGKVKFSELCAECVIGDVDPGIIEKANRELKSVEE